MKHPARKSGFTIVEIMVSVTIMLLFFSVTYAGYSRYSVRQTLITSGQNLKNTLRDVQSRAFNNELDCTPGKCDCSLSDDPILISWNVNFPENKIYGICRTSDDSDIRFSERDLGLAGEITPIPYLSPPADPAVISYYYYPPSANTDGRICLSLSSLPDTYYLLEFNKAGLITDKGILSEEDIPLCRP